MPIIPITLIDRLGFDSHYYKTESGQTLFPADQFDVRLITSFAKLPLAIGDSLSSVVAIREFDHSRLLEAARFQSHLDGATSQALVALHERLLLPAAALREELCIEGDKIADVLPFRDKVTMKTLLDGNGVRVPRFSPYTSEAAHDLLKAHGAIVAKPREGTGGRDLNFIDNVDDINSFERRYDGHLSEFEVEERIYGEFYNVSSVVSNSRVIAAVAMQSVTPTTSFRELRSHCDIQVPDGDLCDKLAAFNQDVISCYPSFTGVTFHELFLSEKGLVFCEIAKRWGGGGIRAAFRARTGIDLIQAMLFAEIRHELPVATRCSDEICGSAWIYAQPGTVMRRDPVLSAPWVLEPYVRLTCGQTVSRPLSIEQAVAIVTVTGRDQQQVAERLELAENEVLGCFH